MVPTVELDRRPFPAVAFISVVVGGVAVSYFLWTPFDVPVRSLGSVGNLVAVSITAGAMVAFLGFGALMRPVGRHGRRLSLTVLLLTSAWLVALVLNGGVLGPRDYTGNFLFRVATVLFALLSGHRLAASGRLKPSAGILVGTGIVLAVGAMMMLAAIQGVTVDAYRNQGVQPIGTASGDAVQVYLVAFAAPLLLLIRATSVRVGLYLMAVAVVAATFRRGPLICVLFPVAILPFLDKSRLSGRRWYIDFFSFSVAGITAGVAIGIDRIFARWIALFQGQGYALSERDVIYPALLSQVFPFDLQTVFGHGVGSTVQILGRMLGRDIFAHNDWLELLVSVGLYGIGAFLLLHFVLARAVWQAVHLNRRIGLVAVALYGQFFLANWIEGVLYGAQHGALLLFFLGATLGWCQLSDHSRAAGSLRTT